MKAGDVVWLLRRDGWFRCEIRYIDHGADGASTPLAGLRLPDGSTDHYPPSWLDAMQALRAATEAVTKARDAVVEAARSMRVAHDTHAGGKAGSVRLVLSAASRLEDLERAEAEARAKLEALR